MLSEVSNIKNIPLLLSNTIRNVTFGHSRACAETLVRGYADTRNKMSRHLARSLATVSLGQVTKAAEWVPDEYVADAMEKALGPTTLSSWNINPLSSTV